MSYYDKHYEVIMRFMDYFVQNLSYYVCEWPLAMAFGRRVKGYRGKANPSNGNRSKAVCFSFELVQVSRDEIEPFVERWALANSDNDISQDKTMIQNILLSFADELVEEYFVYEDSNTITKVILFDGYRPYKREDKKPPQSIFSTRFTAIQPSRADIEKCISFFVAEQLNL
jgi:hypothetical protein